MKRNGNDIAEHLRAAIFCAAVVLLFGAAPLRADKFEQARTAAVDLAVANYVGPAFAAFEEAAEPLPEGVERLCRSGDEGAREELKAAFRELLQAWQAVAILRMAAIDSGDRRARIAPPDHEAHMVRRAVRSAIDEIPAGSFDQAIFDKLSPGAQGLAAFDVLLTDVDIPLGSGETAVTRCAYALQIANHVKRTASAMNSEIARPPVRLSGAEIIQALADGIAQLRVRQQRYAPETSGQSTPLALTSARVDFVARVAALERLYDALELEAMLPESKDWVKTRANSAWRLVRGSDGAGGRADGSTKKPAPAFEAVMDALRVLESLVRREIGAEFGIARPASRATTR